MITGKQRLDFSTREGKFNNDTLEYFVDLSRIDDKKISHVTKVSIIEVDSQNLIPNMIGNRRAIYFKQNNVSYCFEMKEGLLTINDIIAFWPTAGTNSGIPSPIVIKFDAPGFQAPISGFTNKIVFSSAIPIVIEFIASNPNTPLRPLSGIKNTDPGNLASLLGFGYKNNLDSQTLLPNTNLIPRGVLQLFLPKIVVGFNNLYDNVFTNKNKGEKEKNITKITQGIFGSNERTLPQTLISNQLNELGLTDLQISLRNFTVTFKDEFGDTLDLRGLAFNFSIVLDYLI